MLDAEGTSDQNDGGTNNMDLPSEMNRDFTVQGQRKDDTIFLKLRIADSTGSPFFLFHFLAFSQKKKILPFTALKLRKFHMGQVIFETSTFHLISVKTLQLLLLVKWSKSWI